MFVHLFLAILIINKIQYSFQIDGGEIARSKDFPFLASIQTKIAASKKVVHNCGGTIVSTWHILTAAHCFDKVSDPEVIFVLLGQSYNIVYYDQIESNKYLYKAEKIIIHEGYINNHGIRINDIAIVKLVREIQVSKVIKVAELPKPNFKPKVEMKCDIPGWSCSERKPEYHHNLEVLSKQPIMKFNDCISRWFFKARKPGIKPIGFIENQLKPSRGHIFGIQKLFSLCVDLHENSLKKKGLGKGDTGGPLVCNNKPVGVLVLGSNDFRLPPYFANIGTYSKWISKTIDQHTYSYLKFDPL